MFAMGHLFSGVSLTQNCKQVHKIQHITNGNKDVQDIVGTITVSVLYFELYPPLTLIVFCIIVLYKL